MTAVGYSAQHPEKYDEIARKQRERYANDCVFREKLKLNAAKYRCEHGPEIRTRWQPYYNEWMRKWREKNPEKEREVQANSYRRRRKGIWKKRRIERHKCIEYLGGECAICGYNAFETAFHFHHMVPSDKTFGIANKLSHLWKFERLQPELDKCILLCANCHMVIENEDKLEEEVYVHAEQTG